MVYSRQTNGNSTNESANKITSMLTRINISVVQAVSLISANEFADNLSNSNNTGITHGNPNIAVNIWLLPDFAPKAEIKVNIEENPILANSNVKAKRGKSRTDYLR